MNKALINKYWKEFCHWKDGGDIIAYHIRKNEWYEPMSPFTSEVDIYIINDEYVEYRKALAEGKTIQFDSKDGKGFKDWDVDFSASVEDYRIKPDEPEFKVGDYVVAHNFVVTTADEFLIRHDKDLRLWTLEEADDDEWVYAVHDRFELYYSTKRASWCKRQRVKAIPMIGQTPEQLGLEK